MSFVRSVLSRGTQVSKAQMRPAAALAATGFRANFHSQRPMKNAEATAALAKISDTLKTATRHELYQYTNKGLLVLAPVAMVLSPSIINLPVDLALGVIVPVHMHYGLTGIIEDYVPKAQQSVSLAVLLGVSALTGLGLLKINLCGAGMTESVKALWRAPKKSD